MQATIAKLSVLLGADSTAFKKGMKESKSSLDVFSKGVRDFRNMLMAAFSVHYITNFVKGSIDAYKVQEMAEAKLLTALGGRKDIMESLTAQASKLQGVTTWGDEKTIEAQAQLAVVLKDNEYAIMKLTPLVQDFATAMNMDLVSASQLVAKTLGSSTNALARYGISVEGAVNSSARLESMTAALTEKFLGQAKAAGETLSGSMEILKNAWGDVKEEVGRFALTKIIDLEEWKAFFSVMNSPDATNAQKWIVAFGDLMPKRAEKVVKHLDDMKEAHDELHASIARFRKEFAKDEGGEDPVEIKTIAKLREDLKDLKQVREEADINAVYGINLRIIALEKEIQKYEQLGKAITVPDRDFTSSLRGFSEQGAKPTNFSEAEMWGNTFAMDMPVEQFDDVNDALVNKFTAIRETIQEFNDFAEGEFESMAYSIADSLGTALGTGDFENFFGSILGSFGNFAQSMGKMLIAYGISMEAFKKSFTNPLGAVIAGAALVAIGAAIKSAATSPSMGGGSTYSGTSSAPSQSFNSGPRQVELVWRRAGNDLVAIFNETNNANSTLTGRSGR